MISTGIIRVKRAITVPTISATRWEYVLDRLVDGPFESIKSLVWVFPSGSTLVEKRASLLF